MQRYKAKSKLIAKNSLYLFLRMFILTLINLLCVRLILRGLGIEDYGIFNTIAGVVTASSFISSVFAMAIQRFYSYAIGEGNSEGLNAIFSSSINIILILSVIILVVLESIGTWLIYYHLSIPAERMTATLWLFQFSLFTFLLSILQIPFTAAIFAHEDMGTYTVVSTLECILKLVAAILIGYAVFDKLIFYGALLLVVAFVIFITYTTIARKRYSECVYHKVRTKGLSKKILSFSGWSTLGSLASVCMIQGNIILLSMFFGPAINAAFGIAQQIDHALLALGNSVVMAFRPPMIKLYAQRSFDELNRIFYASNKIIFYLFAAVSIPIITEMDTILGIWLGNVPTYGVVFCQLMIVYVVCLSMNNPITIIIQAAGKVKTYALAVESITLLCFPASWILFHFGFPAYYVFAPMIGLCLIAHIMRLVCLKKFYPPFSVRSYITKFALPAIIIAAISFAVAIIMHNEINGKYLRLIIMIVVSPLFTCCLTYGIGITSQERRSVRSIIEKKLWKRH